MWTSFTPTASAGSWTTNVTYTGMRRRDGPDLLMLIHVAISGQPDNTHLRIDIPETVDEAVTFALGVCGKGTAFDSSTTIVLPLSVVYNEGENNVHVYAANGTNVNRTNPVTWASPDFIDLFVRVPISGWGV